MAELLGKDEELTIPLIGSLTSIGDPSAVDALFALLGTPDAAVRKATVGALNALAPPDMVDRVIRLLDDPNPGVREAGVLISGYFGFRQCMETLFGLCRDENENVRRAAVEHLPFLDNDRAPKLLSEALREDVPAVRAAAAAAMAHLVPSEAVPNLIRALGRRGSVGTLLCRPIPGPAWRSEAASTLQRLAQSDKFQQVRIAAFEAL